MSRLSKGRREAFDNIAVGSAISSRERTIAGATPPDFTAVGNSENIAVASDYGEERVVSGSVLVEAEDIAN
jgi:hypothetical protein